MAVSVNCWSCLAGIWEFLIIRDLKIAPKPIGPYYKDTQQKDPHLQKPTYDYKVDFGLVCEVNLGVGIWLFL